MVDHPDDLPFRPGRCRFHRLINSCGNLGSMFGPNMLAWVQAETGSFAMGYYLMAAFMFCAGVLVLTLKYKVNGAAKKDVLLDAKATVQPTTGH